MADKIFINYRRDDSPGDARSVRDGLAAKFGKTHIFMDVDNLLAGQRFDKELAKALDQCSFLIAVVGPRWMELLQARAQSGERDYVREEIAAALKRDIPVIPVRVGREGAMPRIPRIEELPDDIRDFVLHQKQDVAHERFGRDINELVDAISTILDQGRSTSRWVKRSAIFAAAAGTIVAALYFGAKPFEDWRRHQAEFAAKSVAAMEAREAAETQRLAAMKAEEDAQQSAEQKRKLEEQRQAEEAARTAAEERRKAEAQRQAEEAATAAAAAKKKAEEESRAEAERQRVAALEQEKKERAARAARDCDRLAAHPSDPGSATLGVELKNIETWQAISVCQQAAALMPENSRYEFQLARSFDASKQHAKANRIYEALAEKSYAPAINSLGLSYYVGDGVKQNKTEAVRWFRKAAALGNGDAMYSLGISYYNGDGLSEDHTEAARWIYQALESGSEGSIGSNFEIFKGDGDFSVAFYREFQERLRHAGVYEGAIDGKFGPSMRRAIDAMIERAKGRSKN